MISSKQLARVFQTCRGVGNYVNYGNKSFGGVQGYKLESLSKLMDARSPKQKSKTLLHVVANLTFIEG